MVAPGSENDLVSEWSPFRGSEFIVAPISKSRIHCNRGKLQLAEEIQFYSYHFFVFERGYAVTCFRKNEHAGRHLAMAHVASAGRAPRMGDAITDFKANQSVIMENEGITKESLPSPTKAGQYLPKVLLLRL